MHQVSAHAPVPYSNIVSSIKNWCDTKLIVLLQACDVVLSPMMFNQMI